MMYNQLPNYKTGNYQPSSTMLSLSHKPQVLRLHEIESRERLKFSGGFLLALTDLLPTATNKALRSSQFLMKALSALPDVYYTAVTLCLCRRRLGEEYTYIAMYKQKQYLEEGVLLNKKTRLLLFLLEIVSRNLLAPLFAKLLSADGRAFEQSKNGSQKPPPLSLLQKALRGWRRAKQAAGRYLGSAEEIMSNVEWLILMVYMLDWNKHFTFIETLLGIRYAYTYKNDVIREVSYAVEGYLLLATFAVKAAKTLYAAYRVRQLKKQQGESRECREEQRLSPPEREGQAVREKALCRICYDDLKEKSATKCGHTFCWSCIIKTLEISEECPVCRSHCLPREVVQLRNC